jgi:hypothetical protein
LKPPIGNENDKLFVLALRLPTRRRSGNDLMMGSIFTHLKTIAEWIVEINRLHVGLMPWNAIAEWTPVFLDVGQLRDERLK